MFYFLMNCSFGEFFEDGTYHHELSEESLIRAFLREAAFGGKLENCE